MFYSPSTKGFYRTELHGANIPADAAQITDIDYANAMAAQTRGEVLSYSPATGLTSAPRPIGKSELQGYLSRVHDSVLMRGITVNVGQPNEAAVNVLCDGTSPTRADLGLLALFGQQDPTATKTWVDNNGASTMLSGAQFVTLAKLVGTWIDNTYTTLGSTMAAITAGTITSMAQIDAVQWPSA